MKQKATLWGIAIFIILLILFLLFLQYKDDIIGPQEEEYDDYMFEDDFMYPSPALEQESRSNLDMCKPREGYYGRGGYTCEDDKYISVGYAIVSPTDLGHLTISDSRGGGSSVTYKKDLSNNDVKFVITKSGGCGCMKNCYSPGSGSITFGGQSVDTVSDEGPTRYLYELIKDIDRPDVYIVKKNAERLKEINLNGQPGILNIESRSGETCGIYGGTDSSTVIVDYIKSRPYYNCNVENDEVVVRDRFKSGSFAFSQERCGNATNCRGLTFTPVKFCLYSYPPIKRSFTEQGIRADIMGQYLTQLTRGEQIVVPENTYIEISYIVDYFEGIKEPCAIDEIYDIEQQTCVKGIFEAPDNFDAVRELKLIQVGNNQVTFKNTLQIGDKQVTTTRPTYLCGNKDQNWNAPKPSSDCWQTIVSYDGNEWVVNDGAIIELSPFLKLNIYIGAHWDADEQKVDRYENTGILTLDKEALKIIPKEDKQLFLLFGEQKYIEFDFKNELANFNQDQAGFYVVRTTDLLSQQTSTMRPYAISIGTNPQKIEVDTQEYGEVLYTILPYIKLGSETFFDEEMLIHNYIIVPEQPPNTVIINDTMYMTCNANTDCPTGYNCENNICSPFSEGANYVFLFLSVCLIVLAIGGILLFMQFGKKWQK